MAPDPLEIQLHRGCAALGDENLVLPRGRAIPYADITHFAVHSRGFSLGTHTRTLSLRRTRFLESDGPERLARALTQRIAGQPHGLQQLARIAEVERWARQPNRLAAVKLTALICVAVYLVQLRDPFVQVFGALDPPLVAKGQLWRLVTANFLHGASLIPMHLLFNVLGLLGLGMLVERPLGPLRTAVVLGVAGLSAMGASAAVDDVSVIGSSGMVMGLAGAALCLELQCGARLPVWWRVPRIPFVVVLILDGILGFLIPFIAGVAHLGGFIGGYLAASLIASDAVWHRPVENGVRRAAWALAFVSLVSLLVLGTLVSRAPVALERYAWQLLEISDLESGHYNDFAWLMATESDADFEELTPALELARRAVDLSDHRDPDLLDTLAEVLFVRGDPHHTW